MTYSSNQTRAITPGSVATLFDGETVTQGESSIAVAVPANPGGGAAQFSLWLSFAAAPTDAVTVQGANADEDGNYVNTATSSTNKQVDRVDFTCNAPFVRVNVGTFSAGGKLTATLYRAA